MKQILRILFTLFAIFMALDSYAVEYRAYFKALNVEVVDSPNVYIDYPSWARPNPQQNITDLDYWVHEVLPYEESKNSDTYLVYPKHGIVTPVLVPSTGDAALIKNGEQFNHYKYLEKGALHYYGSSPDESEVGNMVIAAHTSDKLGNPGKYKTIFQMLTISVPGDKIFLYKKNDSGSYDLYQYEIQESYRTDKYNVSILDDDMQRSKLTTYGCYVIGSNLDRWVNEAYLISKSKDHSTLSVRSNQRTQDIVFASAPEDIGGGASVYQSGQYEHYPVVDRFVQAIVGSRKKHPETFRAIISYLNNTIDDLTLADDDHSQKLRLLHYIRDGVSYKLGAQGWDVIAFEK